MKKKKHIQHMLLKLKLTKNRFTNYSEKKLHQKIEWEQKNIFWTLFSTKKNVLCDDNIVLSSSTFTTERIYFQRKQNKYIIENF